MKRLFAVPALLTAVLVLVSLDVRAAQAPANARLSISNSLPPSSGVAITTPSMLLRESFATILKRNGLTIVDWIAACEKQSPICAGALDRVQASYVTGMMLGNQAQATFDAVPAGRYYLVAIGGSPTGPVVWDLPVDLRAGANSLRLDATNLTSLTASPATQAPANPATAAARPPATQTPSSPATAAGRPAATDPSLATARKAKVDTRVFGIQLGEPPALPKCDLLNDAFTVATERATCVEDAGAYLGLAQALFPGLDLSADDGTSLTIIVAPNSCPAWMLDCRVTARIHEGYLVGVTFMTKGRGVEQATATDLREKYGAPSLVDAGTVTPDTGNQFTVRNLEWLLPGFHVKYDVVRTLEEDATRVRTTEGMIVVETFTGYELRQAEQKKQLQTRPKL